MNDFAAALHTAVALIGGFDGDLREIVSLSLAVSLTASACAFAIGAPLGTALAVYRFPGRGALVVTATALLGLPPVVVGIEQGRIALREDFQLLPVLEIGPGGAIGEGIGVERRGNVQSRPHALAQVAIPCAARVGPDAGRFPQPQLHPIGAA